MFQSIKRVFVDMMCHQMVQLISKAVWIVIRSGIFLNGEVNLLSYRIILYKVISFALLWENKSRYSQIHQ